MSTAKESAQAALDALKLSIRSEFVPWSQSRNKGEKHRSLNWRVTVVKDGRDVLTTDYSAGIAHCPAYKAAVGLKSSIMNSARIDEECETGRECKTHVIKGAPILPDTCDVFYSLSMDADVLDYPTFEEWADNSGYDADSRSAERIYRACLEIALKLRAAIGDAGLAALREAFQDY